MNVWKRKSMRLLSMLLTFCMLLGLLTLGVSAQPAEANATVTDAILYVINSDGELEYNVVYSAPVNTGDQSVWSGNQFFGCIEGRSGDPG